MYKPNYDEAVFEGSKEAGIGVIVRNDRGEVLAALSEKIPYLGSVVLVEVLAEKGNTVFYGTGHNSVNL